MKSLDHMKFLSHWEVDKLFLPYQFWGSVSFQEPVTNQQDLVAPILSKLQAGHFPDSSSKRNKTFIPCSEENSQRKWKLAEQAVKIMHVKIDEFKKKNRVVPFWFCPHSSFYLFFYRKTREDLFFLIWIQSEGSHVMKKTLCLRLIFPCEDFPLHKYLPFFNWSYQPQWSKHTQHSAEVMSSLDCLKLYKD